jgi:hypothetical protein
MTPPTSEAIDQSPPKIIETEVARTPADVHVITEVKHHASWKVRLAKLAFGAMAVLAAEHVVSDHVPHIPDIPGAIRHGLEELGGAASATRDTGKAGADQAVHDLSNRHTQPLKVNAADVIAGKIENIPSFGLARREYLIKDADKEYDSRFGDEHIHYRNGIYVGKSYLPTEGFSIVHKGNELKLFFPAAVIDPDVSVKKDHEPQLDPKPGLLPQIGQVPGKQTNTNPGRAELDDYAQALKANDEALQANGACSGITSLYSVTAPLLKAVGFDVIFSDGTHFDATKKRSRSFEDNVRVDHNPNDIVLDIEAQMPGKRIAYLNLTDCKIIFAKSGSSIGSESLTDANGLPVANVNGTAVQKQTTVLLPQQVLNKLKLN